MYTVVLNPFGSADILHDPDKKIFLASPVLTMEENCAGSFEFDIPPDHPAIDAVKRLKCIVSVYRDGTEIWCGRPTEEETSFLGIKHVYCEGLLAALHDTIQPPAEFHDNPVSTWISTLLANHRSQISPTYPWRPYFYTGNVTVEDNLYRYTNYETTLDCINGKLIERLGGHLRLRRWTDSNKATHFYLDYLKAYPKKSSQVIRFGQNLLDYVKHFDSADFATVIVPLGAMQETSDIDALEKYLDVSSVNNGKIFVQNDSLVSLYGKITQVVRWDDVTTASELLKKAKAYLAEMQYDTMQLEIKAVDFHLADSDVEAIDLLDEIRVVSEPHGLDRYFPVTKMEIPLDDPANMTLTLGTSVPTSLTSKTNSSAEQLKAQIETRVPASTILKQAEARATQMIVNGEHGGHVVVLPDELYIADSPDITKATKLWRFNLNGLGYSNSGKPGPYGLAITMDGEINANYITAGNLSADRIHGGTLTLGGRDNGNGVLQFYDFAGHLIGTWDNKGLSTSYIKAEKEIYVDGSFGSFLKIPISNKGDYTQMWKCGLKSRYTTGFGPYWVHVGYQSAKAGGFWPVGVRVSQKENYDDGGAACTITPISINFDDGNGGSQTQLGNSSIYLHGSMYASGNFQAAGTKSRVADTASYGRRLLYCYEMPTPIFGDIGQGVTDETGECIIDIDDIFSETIYQGGEYQVFLQAEGDGLIYVADKQPQYFIVRGQPGMRFAWEIKAKQSGYAMDRLEAYEEPDTEKPDEEINMIYEREKGI